MTDSDAVRIITDFYAEGQPEEDVPLYEDACLFLLEERGDFNAAASLGGYYYYQEMSDLAAKYLAMAADHGISYGCIWFGKMWYYGYTGETDYEKAFRCFAKALEILTGEHIERKSLWKVNRRIHLRDFGEYEEYFQSACCLARMYRHGQYVEQSYSHYRLMIRTLYAMVSTQEQRDFPDWILPELELEMADIAMHGSRREALEFLFDARSRAEVRIRENGRFEDYRLMRDIVVKICSLEKFRAEGMDLYDLYYVLQRPCTVTFRYGSRVHRVTAEKEGQGMAVSLDGKWFYCAEDLMRKGRISGRTLSEVSDCCYDYDIICAQ